MDVHGGTIQQYAYRTRNATLLHRRRRRRRHNVVLWLQLFKTVSGSLHLKTDSKTLPREFWDSVDAGLLNAPKSAPFITLSRYLKQPMGRALFEFVE